MAGCSVLGCSNRSEKGFIMKYFPKDPQRRKEWIANMKRKNWTPTEYAVICEVHFASEMWEKTRVDGTRKLKRYAIPTLFCFTKPKSVKKTPKGSVAKPIEVSDINKPSTSGHTRTASTNIDVDSTSIAPQEPVTILIEVADINMPSPSGHKRTASTDIVVASTSIPLQEPVTLPIEVTVKSMPRTSGGSTDTDANSTFTSASSAEQRSNKALELKCREYNRHFKILFTKYKIIKNNLRNCQTKLKAAMDADGNAKIMKTIFNDDQINAMKRSSNKCMKWSTDTLKNSLKLKSACGIKGYKELLHQKYPLPSLRTLRRHQEKLKLETIRLSEV